MPTSTARAVSGAGTKLRRRSFGSDRISAVTSSSRSAGTCQANSSPPNRASTSTGTCTVTPSSAAPGSNRYVRGSARSPASHTFGRSASSASSVRSRSSRVNVNRSGRAVPLLFPPRVEMPGRHHLGRDAGVVQRVDVVVADQQIAAAGPLLQLLELRPQRSVVAEEVMAGLPVALDQRVPDEQLPRQLRFDPRVPDPAPRAPAAGRTASPARRPSPPRASHPSAARCRCVARGPRRPVRPPLAGCAPPSARTAGWFRPARPPRPSAAAACSAPSPAPGRTANCARRGIRGRPHRRMPTCDSSPASSAACTRAASAGSSDSTDAQIPGRCCAAARPGPATPGCAGSAGTPCGTSGERHCRTAPFAARADSVQRLR